LYFVCGALFDRDGLLHIVLAHATVGDGDGDDGRVAAVRLAVLDARHELHALEHLAEHDVLAVEPARDDGGDKELAAVRVLASVGHGEHARARVLQLEVLVSKLSAVDGLAARAVALGEVTTLEHEVLDHTVENAALEVQGLTRLADSLFTSAKRAEVLRRLRDDIGEELEGDAAGRLTANGDIEKDLRLLICLSSAGALV